MIHDDRNCSFIHHRKQQGFISIKLEIDIKGEKGCFVVESLKALTSCCSILLMRPKYAFRMRRQSDDSSVRVLVECAGEIVCLRKCEISKAAYELSLNFLIAHPQR